MFTIEQINDLHEQLGELGSLPDYLQALNAIGVTRFNSYLFDGHSEFFDRDGQGVVSVAAHELLRSPTWLIKS